jgi:hypothetical protein
MKDLKGYIRRCVDRWIPIVGLENWEVHVLFNESDDLANNKTQPEYLDTAVNFNIDRINGALKQGWMTKGAVDKMVLHELVHALVWPLSQAAGRGQLPTKHVEYLEEQLTTQIENAIWRASGRSLKDV